MTGAQTRILRDLVAGNGSRLYREFSAGGVAMGWRHRGPHRKIAATKTKPEHEAKAPVELIAPQAPEALIAKELIEEEKTEGHYT